MLFFLDVKVKCKLTFDITCWKETRAGETFIQPCPFLFYSTKGKQITLNNTHLNYNTVKRETETFNLFYNIAAKRVE